MIEFFFSLFFSFVPPPLRLITRQSTAGPEVSTSWISEPRDGVCPVVRDIFVTAIPLSLSFSFSFGGVFILSSFFSFIHFIIYIYFWLLFWFVWGGLSLGATVVSPPSTGTSARHQHNNSSGGGSSSNSSSSSSSSSSSFAAALRHLAKQAGGPTTTATQSTNHSDPGTITDVFFCPTRRARHNFVDS